MLPVLPAVESSRKPGSFPSRASASRLRSRNARSFRRIAGARGIPATCAPIWWAWPGTVAMVRLRPTGFIGSCERACAGRVGPPCRIARHRPQPARRDLGGPALRRRDGESPSRSRRRSHRQAAGIVARDGRRFRSRSRSGACVPRRVPERPASGRRLAVDERYAPIPHPGRTALNPIVSEIVGAGESAPQLTSGDPLPDRDCTLQMRALLSPETSPVEGAERESVASLRRGAVSR